jgi:NAD(P)-dependent dehydrogenase (short-subunit alcohol dehydrogenase family)
MLGGTTAIVTGVSQGLGRQIALTLAEHGAEVAVAARGDGIHDTTERIADDRALAVELDLTDESSVVDAIDRTVAEFGGLDCVVNNAGIAGPTAHVEDVSTEEWHRTLDVNLTGPFLMVKHAVPHLRSSENASVVNIGSSTGKRPLPERTPYAASKIGMIGLTRTLAFELGDAGVRVNTICPGPMDNQRLRETFQRHADQMGVSYEEALYELILSDQAIEEILTTEEVAEAVAFLASPNGRHITAQDINVDAGLIWY